ncbi:hypothetical protein BN4901_1346 [Citrobacter europaeus]|uniref:Uncharacterized protein n=1 Tax=Citrobacter europaeus TaxID=1914243 RepID=A0ABY0JLH5_9ENTR|nr:hypothetical protein CIP106467_0065 [Citrobacter europaeus]SBW23905.1 hypothetical protein BN4901_1346 [Citrobacter europaeus]
MSAMFNWLARKTSDSDFLVCKSNNYRYICQRVSRVSPQVVRYDSV